MELMPGYKRSDVGVIPDDWDVVSVKQLVEEEILEKPLDGNHGNIHPKSSDYVGYGIPFVMANNFVNGEVDLNGCKFITKERADRLQKGFAVTGDILLTHKGTVGSTAIVGELNTDYIMLTPQVTYYRVRDANRLDNRFLRHYFDSSRFQSLFASLAGGGTRAYLGIVKQLDLPIIKPPVAEQRAIAKTLCDVDALLVTLDQMIAKKRDLKQAAMQQLLTGETRLPGFIDEWQLKRLGDVVDTDPENLGTDTASDFCFNYISLEDVDLGQLRNHSEQIFIDAPSRARRKLMTNDVLVSTVRPNLQSHLLFKGDTGHWVCSTGFCVAKTING